MAPLGVHAQSTGSLANLDQLVKEVGVYRQTWTIRRARFLSARYFFFKRDMGMFGPVERQRLWGPADAAPQVGPTLRVPPMEAASHGAA